MNAQSGFHDDCVTSCAIAWQALKTLGIPEPVEPFKGKFLREQTQPVRPDGTLAIDPHVFYPKAKKSWRRW